jgi:hypothetical protein
MRHPFPIAKMADELIISAIIPIRIVIVLNRLPERMRDSTGVIRLRRKNLHKLEILCVCISGPALEQRIK